MLPIFAILCAVILFMPKEAKAMSAEQVGLYVDKAVIKFTPDSSEVVQSYTILMKKNEGEWKVVQTINGGGERTVTVTGLKPTDSYINIKAAYKYKYSGGSDRVYDLDKTVWEVKMLPAKISGLVQDVWYYYIKQIDAKWNRQNSISGYQTEFYGPSMKKVRKHTLSGTFKNYNNYKVVNGKSYKMRVRGYTEFNGKKYYGAWSAYTWFVGQTPKINLKSKKKKITVTWGKVAGATSYTVMVATSANGKYKAVKTIAAKKKAKVTFKKFAKKKLKKGKNYYVYVRSNKKVGKKTFNSNSKGKPLYYSIIKCK